MQAKSSTVNKRQLIAAAARRSSLTRRQMREALDAIVETVTEALAEGRCVSLSDLGQFSVRKHSQQIARGIDGRPHRVRDVPVPTFSSSKVLRRRIRKGP